MKRNELIQVLKSKLKSLRYTDFDDIKYLLMKDEEGKIINDSILVSTTENHPWKIHADYGLGIETKYDGQKYISVKYKDNTISKMCSISIMDFGIAFHWVPLDAVSGIEVYPTNAAALLEKLDDGVQHFIYREI